MSPRPKDGPINPDELWKDADPDERLKQIVLRVFAAARGPVPMDVVYDVVGRHPAMRNSRHVPERVFQLLDEEPEFVHLGEDRWDLRSRYPEGQFLYWIRYGGGRQNAGEDR